MALGFPPVKVYLNYSFNNNVFKPYNALLNATKTKFIIFKFRLDDLFGCDFKLNRMVGANQKSKVAKYDSLHRSQKYCVICIFAFNSVPFSSMFFLNPCKN